MSRSGPPRGAAGPVSAPSSRATSGCYDHPSLYAPDPNLGSVVSYPSRCRAWGDAGYRGNCDGTLFKELVLRYRARRIADPMMGSGTTRDVVAGLNRHTRTGIEYWGADLRTGFDLLKDPLPGPFDLIWVHPPYWDIIRYSQGDPRDLSSTANWRRFCLRLSAGLIRCTDALAPGGHLAVLVGDVRRRGAYFSMAAELLADKGISGELRSVIIKVQHNCTSDRKAYAPFTDVPIRHEYCLVFQRPRVAVAPQTDERA